MMWRREREWHFTWPPHYINPLASKAFELEEYCYSKCLMLLHLSCSSLSVNMDGKKLEYKGEEALKEIERLTAKADEVQKNILKEILSRNSETEYLIKYMKGSKNVLEFKRGVPVITYKAIRPYIQRIVNGEDSSLITGHSITEMLSRYYYFLFFCELINELVWILFLGFL